MTSLLMQYWRFYWPLALTGTALVISGQFQNGALARYPDAVTELAIFALAMGTFGPFQAALNFVSQLSNVFGRTQENQLKTLRFVLLIAVVVSIPLMIIALTPGGNWLISLLYNLETPVRDRVLEYIFYLTPLVYLNGVRQYYLGLLIQSRLTGRVTVLNFIYLATVVLVLVTGFNLGWVPVAALVGAQGAGAVVHLFLLVYVKRSFYSLPQDESIPPINYRELFDFYLPVTLTGVMFAVSRPVLYALIGRTPEAIVSIAAMRVGFDFSFLFQSAANQFRHFFVTFGDDDLAAKRLFMALVALGLTLLMLMLVLTPVNAFVLSDLIGVTGVVLDRSREVILVMCLLPGIIVLRNYFHGLLMHHRKTAGMAFGSLLRVAGIYLVASLLLAVDRLDHISGTFVLLLGFVIETVIVYLSWLRARGQLALIRR